MKKKKYEYNHLACCSDACGHVNHIMDKLEGSKGVVLYFHGGLSTQEYMKNELGPKLMESIFKAKNLDGLYPIFINYDAGFLDEDNWCCLLRYLYATNEFLKKAIKYFEVYFEKNKNKSNNEKEIAQNILNKALEKHAKGTRNKFGRKDYLDILEDPKLQESIGKKLIKESDLKEINRDKGIFGTIITLKVLSRSVARIAIGNNHQIVPTLEEELFRELRIDHLAKKHWRTVKKHSEQCNSKKFVGSYLISRLLEKKENDENFTINTVSHSAGAIPTAHLIKYMKKKNKKLDSVVMIVPAINQEDFSRLVIDNKKGFKKLKLYALDLEAEKDDNVATVYPASLLYFVSGSAEEKGYGDKMLLIAQHLDETRKPYSDKKYLRRVKEKPQKIWKYLKKNDVLTYCPSQLNVSNPEKDQYSHSSTKKPWITKTLARAILFDLTGKNVDTDFAIKQKIDKSTNECADVKCLF